MTQPPEYDLKETVNSTSINTPKSGVPSALVIPLIVLIVAVLAALAWWFFTRPTTATVPVDTTAPVTTTTPSNTTTPTPTDPNTIPAGGTDANGDIAANPDGTSSVVATEDVGGINPQEPLQALSGTNPFNPLKGRGVKTQAIANTTDSTSSNSFNNNAASTDNNAAGYTSYEQPRVTISEPRSSSAAVQSAMDGTSNTSGLAAARRGINRVNNNVSTVKEQSSTWNTTNNSYTTTGNTNTTNNTNNTHQSNSSVSNHAAQGNGYSGKTTANNADERKPKPAPRPPLVGMTRPQAVSVPSGIKSTGSVAASSATLPNPGVPAALESMPTPIVTTPTQTVEPAPKAAAPIAQYLEQHQATLSGVVIGATKTAIFKTKHGFVVVAENQKIPETSIVVRDIHTQGVTLVEPHQTMALKINK